MYRLVYSIVFVLAFSILSHARHAMLTSHSRERLPRSSESDVCMTPACVIAAADVLTSLDETVDPCDDFYSFACGGWMKRQEVTDDQPRINVFITSRKDLNRKLRELIESKIESSDLHFVKILKGFYNVCEDSDTLEKQGSEPLIKILRRLGGWPVVDGSQWDASTFDWVETLIALRKMGYEHEIIFNMYESYIVTDENDTINFLILDNPYLGKINQANLTLGLDDPIMAEHYKMMLMATELLGAEKEAAMKELLEVLHFEMDLLNITYGENERNRTEKTIAELQKELPQVPWLKLINGLLLTMEVSENQTIKYSHQDFLPKIVELMTSTNKRVIANYMLWRVVLESKNYLSEEWREIQEEDEESKDRNGPEMPRWKNCLTFLKRRMQMGLASFYVRHYFNDESKEEAMMLMKYVHKEFLKLLENNDWMDQPTKEKAEAKANAIKAYIGYPEELLNDTYMMKLYENLSTTNESYLQNILIFQKWETDKRFSGFTKVSADRYEKKHTIKYDRIVEVNAFYSSYENSIAIPAGILHDAFYDKDKPEYMNFAEIGYVIGHEITHGFDNEGRNFDENGNHEPWWDEKSDENFRKKVKCMIDQYDNYTTFIGLKVNGEKTQNENIADNGGLKEAYLAYQSWIKDHGTEPLLPGLNYNQNQIFWLSAARVWCSKYQPETLKKILLIDVHSPGKFRIIGPMSNLAEFSKDFNCSPDAPMNRKYKCEVW